MRFMNIASGSAGNATYVGNDHTHILIDTGISRKRLTEGLKRLDLSWNDITGILITHEHSDHIASLAMVERQRPIPVYATQGTWNALTGKGKTESFREMLHAIRRDEDFTIGDISITALPVSHDAAEPVCYRLRDGNSSCAVVTDLGIYDSSLTQQLKDLSVLMIEANHDIRMLETGPYPYPLKRRIAGAKGHLSNESSGRMLSELLHDSLQHVVLGHLSQKNNYRELAQMAVEQEIDASDRPYQAKDFPIHIADPASGTVVFQF